MAGPRAAVGRRLLPLAAELILATTTRRADRKGPVTITAAQIQEHSETAVEGPFTPAESRCLPLATVVLLWCNEPLHGVPPAVVALIGALVATSPALGTVRFKDGLRTVPWPLLFMAATMAMGVALPDPGAADWPVGWIPLGAPTRPGFLGAAACAPGDGPRGSSACPILRLGLSAGVRLRDALFEPQVRVRLVVEGRDVLEPGRPVEPDRGVERLVGVQAQRLAPVRDGQRFQFGEEAAAQAEAPSCSEGPGGTRPVRHCGRRAPPAPHGRPR